MASYFELPARLKSQTAADASTEEREKLRGASLLSPQISHILDSLELEDKSSSSDEIEEDNSSGSENDEESRLSDDNTKIDNSISRKSRQVPPSTANTVHGSKTSAKSGLKGIQSTSGRSAGDKSLKSPRSHMARFQSLRSSLFQANIENNMKKCHQEAEAREKAATNWKAQHEKRQGYNRPHTPENAPSEKDGFGRRISMKVRRLTSKEPPTMANIEENTGTLARRESTASDDDDDNIHSTPWRPRQSYESSIDHSDVDELVRWVSRRDPPSDGERGTPDLKITRKEDSGHESLGHSDIEELVRHASRKSIALEPVIPPHAGYSDESTASDSELSQEDDGQDEESLEGSLSRWVSRRDGAMAGPVRQQRSAMQIEPDTDPDESDVPEIGRWRTHHDTTSGESLADTQKTVQGDDKSSVLEVKRGRSRERPSTFQDKGHLHDDDVDDLVRWVSQRDSQYPQNLDGQDAAAGLNLQEEEKKKKQKLGMTVDDKSLTPEDLEDLLAHVKSRNYGTLNSSITPAHV
ncbi:hypothetical protein E8E13_005993 [Curvularia kusanoi]|uniref:Uncharacterized protein n=1 Tax=Curvularia kusanoi TaxID=90978 RepID=A0A9P4WD85_CURKU|nr:hypothetical protein E8E13_005993 [Curvularia kusanoi]